MHDVIVNRRVADIRGFEVVVGPASHRRNPTTDSSATRSSPVSAANQSPRIPTKPVPRRPTPEREAIRIGVPRRSAGRPTVAGARRCRLVAPPLSIVTKGQRAKVIRLPGTRTVNRTGPIGRCGDNEVWTSTDSSAPGSCVVSRSSVDEMRRACVTSSGTSCATGTRSIARIRQRGTCIPPPVSSQRRRVSRSHRFVDRRSKRHSMRSSG